MSQNNNSQSTLLLKLVRLRFHNVFKPKAFEEGHEPKYPATFLLDKTTHAADIATIRAAAKTVAEEKWGKGKVPGSVKYCLRDGAEKSETDGYGEGVMFISSTTPRKPLVVDKDKVTPLDGSEGRLYAGCYVHARVRLWAQDNKFGKRVNAELTHVMFAKDGDPFGDKPVAAEEAFAGVSAEEDDSDEEARRLMGE